MSSLSLIIKLINEQQKMLYYRFSEWNFPPKYRRAIVSKRRTSRILPFVPTRALDLYGSSEKLHTALASVGHYLDDICDVKFWRLPGSNNWIDIQWLISSTHMAVNSVAKHHDVHAAWTGFRALESKVERIMMSLCHIIMHPRVLSALLRLLIDGLSVSELQVRTITVVRSMFAKISKFLPENHPVRMLCSLQSESPPDELVSHFFGIFNGRLYGKISCSAPKFVACEKI